MHRLRRPSCSSVSLEVCQDTRKQFFCLIRAEIAELDFEIEPPEDGRIKPVHQVGGADERAFEL